MTIKNRLELVYAHLCGPITSNSFKNFSYILKFTDHFTRLMKVYFLTKKSETSTYLCHHPEDLPKPANVRLQVLRTENGREFTSHIFKDVR
ncbi:unnamed protein product [Discosporangium mesarthrocarpum]